MLGARNGTSSDFTPTITVSCLTLTKCYLLYNLLLTDKKI